MSRYGKIIIHKEHDYYIDNQRFRVTPYMQELLLYASKDENYLDAEAQITRYLRVLSDDSQINRICQYYGKKLEEASLETESVLIDKATKDACMLEENEVVYGMSDGTMIHTREDGGSWKEMIPIAIGIGRIFKASKHLDLGKKANIIRESMFVSHFGGHEVFSEKFESVVDCYEGIGERLVFIHDGASWINNWIKSSYPKSTNILDYYHGAEYIYDFSKIMWQNKGKREEWSSVQTALLLNDEVSSVIDNITQIETRSVPKIAAKRKILTYYKNNQDRMLYKTYRQRGILIGSGPLNPLTDSYSKKG